MDPISSLSRPFVKTFITGAAGIEPVEIAFTAPGVEPIEDDWNAAEWETPTLKGCAARILIGPDATITLADGTYDMWVRVTGTLTRPVWNTGQVAIT